MNINNFIWADSSLIDLKIDNPNHSLILKINNYRNDSFIIIFEEINHLYVNDPVYFMEVKNNKKDKQYQIEFWDDEEKVLSFDYSNVAITNC